MKPKIEVYSREMRTIQDLFKIGMSRVIPNLYINDDEDSVQINVGAGTYKTLHHATPIDYPEWDARKDFLPYKSGEVDVIHCYHFLEHFEGDVVVRILQDFQRVLKIGGYVNIVVPYYNSHLQAKCLDHKSMFNESTWDNLFNQYSYDNGSGDWDLEVHTTFIMGVEEKNLALLTQLVHR